LCLRCATTMQPLGEDVSEQLARVAAAFKVIRMRISGKLNARFGEVEQARREVLRSA
ncbi:transposase, partial [Paraburkholderia tropica]|nr:transposase [Paraburkholderia tropica]